MKFPYPITANYITNWNLTHALREIIANAFDAEDQLHARAHVKYDTKNQRLLVRNENTTVDHRAALYFGESTKRGSDCIGQYGEGLKLAMLVFARLGMDVVIKNGANETWKPSLEKDKLGVECLTLDITPASRKDGHFDVVINDINEEAWDLIRSWFLRLTPAAVVQKTSYGELLDDPEFTGKIFVRGVYVCTRPKYEFGYNFFRVETGRDRQIPSSFDINFSITMIWDELAKRGDAATHKQLYKGLASEAAENEAFDLRQPDGLTFAMVSEFKKEYGENAIPVSSTSEGSDLEHLGVATVPLPQRLVSMLRRTLPSPERVRQDHAEKIVARHALGELTKEERANLDYAFRKLEPDIEFVRSRVIVTTFGSATIEGLHRGAEVFIARRILCDFGKLMMVLIHEFAHDDGPDGTKAHVDAIHRYSEAVIRRVREEITQLEALVGGPTAGHP